MKNNKLLEQIKNIAKLHDNSSAAKEFVTRLEIDERLTRDENPYTHFCIYLEAYDPKAREVFVGHHKKSGLWLFNGGHIDEGETLEEALIREIGEEWGLEMKLDNIGDPKLLTVTTINNPTKQTCTKHYDIWYFVPVDKNKFDANQELLTKEFHTAEWSNTKIARNLITDPNTIEAVNQLETLFMDK